MNTNNMYTFTLVKRCNLFKIKVVQGAVPKLSITHPNTLSELLITPQGEMTQTSHIWHVDVGAAGAKLPSAIFRWWLWEWIVPRDWNVRQLCGSRRPPALCDRPAGPSVASPPHHLRKVKSVHRLIQTGSWSWPGKSVSPEAPQTADPSAILDVFLSKGGKSIQIKLNLVRVWLLYLGKSKKKCRLRNSMKKIILFFFSID